MAPRGGVRAWIAICVLVGQSIATPATADPSRLQNDEQPVPDHRLRAEAALTPTGSDLVVMNGKAFVMDVLGGITLVDNLNDVPLGSGHPTGSLGASSMLAIDLDGDGTSELVATTENGDLTQVGDAVTPLIDIGVGVDDMIAANVDDDAEQEAVVLHGASTEVTVLDPDGGTLVPSAPLPLDDPADVIAAGDLQGDGIDEIVTAADGIISVLSLNGTPAQNQLASGVSSPRIARVEHLDDDGYLDLAFVTPDGVSVLTGAGDGTFALPFEIDIDDDVADVEAGVLDRDAGTDLAIATADHIMLLSGHNDGTFGAPTTLDATTHNVGIEIVELNGDSVEDLVVLEDGGNKVAVLRTNRAPSLSDIDAIDVIQEDTISLVLEATDVDGDELTFQVEDAPAGSSFDPQTGSFQWTPMDMGASSLVFGVSDWADSDSCRAEMNVLERVHVGTIHLAGFKTAALTRTVRVAAHVEGAADHVSFLWARAGTSDWHPIGKDFDGSDGWSTEWDTAGKDGRYRVRSTANLGTETSSDTQTVLVDNRPPTVRLKSARAFSPNGDGRHDRLRVVAKANEPTRLEISLRRNGKILRRWRKSALSRRLVVEWSGKVDGRRLRDDRYKLHVRAIDRGLHRSSDIRRIRIDTKAPRFRWTDLPSRMTTKAGGFDFRYRTRDRSGQVRVRLALVQNGYRVAGKTQRPSGRRGSWSRGRYADGVAFVPGKYAIRAKVRDKLGNSRTIRTRAWQYAPPVKARAYMRLENTGRRVALTFDDCNYESSWDSILDTLRAHRVKATFFCGGSLVRRFPNMARRVVREGHDAASHGYNHLLMPSLSYTRARSQILGDRSAWAAVTGDAGVPYFRPPYGAYNSSTLAVAGSLGYSRVMIWDVDTSDWQGRSASAISSHVLGNARAGSVVLMHVLPNTAASLPAMLRGLKARGLKPVTLSTLFRAAGHH